MSSEIFNLTEAQFTSIRYFVSEMSAETGMVIPPWSRAATSSWYSKVNTRGEIESIMCWLSTVYIIKVDRDGHGSYHWGNVDWR